MESRMSKPNQLSRNVAGFQKLPAFIRPWATSFALGKVVPLVGTAGLRFDELSSQRVVVRIRNRKPVQNHIKGVHAAAMALLAETATGFCVGMNLPDDKLPLIKSMKVDYLKRAVGDMSAVAELRPEQIQQILTLDKGEVTVPVRISDESGQEPIQCEMVWAWVPKKRG
jgi:acyl-coenzyme A thioesterase PaaI-like protein